MEVYNDKCYIFGHLISLSWDCLHHTYVSTCSCSCFEIWIQIIKNNKVKNIWSNTTSQFHLHACEWCFSEKEWHKPEAKLMKGLSIKFIEAVDINEFGNNCSIYYITLKTYNCLIIEPITQK